METAAQPADLTERITRTSNYCTAVGGFGDIWQCLLQTDENQIVVAVKVIRLQDEGVDEKALRRELGMWKRLKHANILPLLGIVRDFGPYISMVSPWLEHGSLTVYLRKHKDLCLSDRLRLLEDITSGLHYLHCVSVVHGDLTPNNVLLDGENRAVLTDFGLSSKLVGQGHTYLQRSCAQPGAVRYAAPELLCSNEPIQPDTRSDVYSFGCIALQVLSGHMPWADVEYERIVMFKVINGETPQRPDESQISDAHWHLIQPCLSRLGATPPRPSTSEILTFLGKELQSEVISSTGHPSQSLQDDITPQPTVALETPFSSQSNSMTSPSNRRGKKREIAEFDVESTPRAHPRPPNTPQPTVALETLCSIQSNSMTSPSNRKGKRRRIVRFDVESTPPGKRTRPGPPSPSFWGVPLPPAHNQRHSFGHNNRPASPPNTSPQQCQIHPLLNGKAYGSDLYFDIANPTFTPLRRVGPDQMVMLSDDELRELATFPPVINMRITHDVIPQWPIKLNLVHGEYDVGNPLPLTVGDILYMIHSSLHRRTSRQDWARLDQSEETAIALAYTRRCRSIPFLAEMEASQGVKRVDYLMDRHVFRGLKVAEGDSSYHWKLLT